MYSTHSLIVTLRRSCFDMRLGTENFGFGTRATCLPTVALRRKGTTHSSIWRRSLGVVPRVVFTHFEGSLRGVSPEVSGRSEGPNTYIRVRCQFIICTSRSTGTIADMILHNRNVIVGMPPPPPPLLPSAPRPDYERERSSSAYT
jgi:hypothetical protein